jgi:leader peptidase (prepilin peptidase) / N-methyltransferase
MIRDQIRIWGTVFAALLGLAFGSFLNVCLSRWPEGESIITPRSHCRKCGRVLKWWENVPLVSWVALRGRCRSCEAWIGWRYVIVEAVVGGLWAATAWRYVGWVLDPKESSHVAHLALLAMLAKFLFYWLVIGLAVLDAENLWLPDWLTWPGILLGTAFSLFPWYVIDRVPLFGLRRADIAGRVFRSVLASLAASALVLLIYAIYWLIRRREGIGLGDAKLMAMLAAWLGLPGALAAFAIAVVLGALAALLVLKVRRQQSGERPGLLKMPLGTFLCVGGMITGLWGWQIIAVYLKWAGF